MARRQSLGQYLNVVLAKQDMTARDLAIGAGLAQSVVSTILTDKSKKPDANTLQAIATFLGIEVFTLLRLVGYTPPANELYGAYTPLGLYVSKHFDALSEDNQRVVLHLIEALRRSQNPNDGKPSMDELHKIWTTVEPLGNLYGIEDALPEFINQAANYYLTNNRFFYPFDINPSPDELIARDVPFSALSKRAQKRLLALMRAKVRMIFEHTMVDEEAE